MYILISEDSWTMKNITVVKDNATSIERFDYVVFEEPWIILFSILFCCHSTAIS